MGTQSRARLLEGLLVAALVVVGVTLVLLPLLSTVPGVGADPQGVSVRARLSEPAAALPRPAAEQYRGDDAVVLTGPVTVAARVEDPGVAQQVTLVGSTVLGGLTALGVLALLLQVTRTLRAGDVFVPDNARRLQRIALLVGLGGTAAQLLHQVGRSLVLVAPAVDDDVVQSFEISFLPLLAAFAVGVAAEVFRQGTALREDVEGLV